MINFISVILTFLISYDGWSAKANIPLGCYHHIVTVNIKQCNHYRSTTDKETRI
jgi:hypothetical protein